MDDRGQAWLIPPAGMAVSLGQLGLLGLIARLGPAAPAEPGGAYLCYNGEQCQKYRNIAILSGRVRKGGRE
ncbi:hypothetical protein J27TS7_20360 [Paenibacillus dendritiformis]|nr:hypothetical protein J27TS7_20360 [Paenibacillus dendritiformis]